MNPTGPFLQGQLLLDGGKLQGSFFHRSVVLICRHDEEGAFGLVLNRRTPNRLEDVLVADIPEGLKESELFLGGPVQTSALSYLHTAEYLPEANVMENLNLGHSLDELMEIAGVPGAGEGLRIFAGYAGWSPGQLEQEMARDAWLTHPARLDLVFHAEAGTLWRRVLEEKGPGFELLASSPDDPSLN